MDHELQSFLEGQFEALKADVLSLKREVHLTRVAVAVISAIAIGTTSVQTTIAAHDAAALELRYQKGTSDALDKSDKRREVRDVEIARKAVQMRDEEVDRIIGARSR
jgi:hypothetical protein